MSKLLNFLDYRASPNQSNTPSAAKTLKDIKVTPAPPPPPLPPPTPPEILTFSSKIPIYRETDTVKSGTASQPSSTAQLPTTPIKLNWVIANPDTIKELQLTTFAVGLNGAIPTTAPKTYSLEKNIPVGCQLQNQLLKCENIPIDTKAPGQYKFMLTAIPKEKYTKQIKEVSKNIDAVEIKPMLPQIESFQVNTKMC